MALPNKKQLNKHKRGTRKALDTLDAIENLEDEILDGINIESEAVDKNTSSKSGSKSSEKKAKKSGKNKSKKKTEVKPKIEMEEGTDSEKKEDIAETELSLPNDSVEEVVDTPTTPDIQPSSKKVKENMIFSEPEEIPEEKEEKLEPVKTTSVAAPVEKPVMETPTVTTSKATDKPSSKAMLNTDSDDDESDVSEDTLQDRYLTFQIGQEAYGVEIRYVTEIIVIQKITEVPETPEYIRGVINLRGMVIPVMDVRQRFHMPPREYDDRTCIIVVDFEGLAVGLIVDVVNEVVDIPETDVDPPPSAHSGIQRNYIRGMGKIGKKVKILLDIEKVLDRKNVTWVED